MTVQQNEGIENKDEKDKVLPQIFTILVVCTASISAGATFAWTSPFIVKVTEDKVNYNITEDEASIFVFLHPLGWAIFGLFTPRLSDLIGRKPCMFLLAIPQVAFWIITALTRSIYGFYVAKIIAGLADGINFGVIPIYIGEIALPRIRGVWGNVIPFYMLGEFLVNVIAQWFTVWQTAYIFLPVCGVYLVLLLFIPESPYYFLMKDKEEQALKSLRFLRGKENVEKEFLQLKSDVKRQMSETGRWRDFVKIRSNRKAVLAAIFLRVSQQVAGVSIFQSYTQYIFEKSGSDLDSGMSTIIVTFLNFIMTFCSGFFIEYFGRKKTYLFSFLLCALILVLESCYFYIDLNTDIDLGFMTWFPLVGMVAIIVASGFGVTPIPTLMTGELFSTSIKAKATSLMTSFAGAATGLNIIIFYQMNSHFGLFVPFATYGVCCIFFAPLIMYVIPETKGRTLEQIQQSLKKNKKDGRSGD